ncbi:response regulator transcription factor [Paenibacillus sp. GCM10027626]|uniref:response regulator transcription factor n=1 Tax=Paenibacillus sp. GCM10027626 TaxID=3273411 RepID=UPI003625A960
MKCILYIEDDVEIGQWTKEDLQRRGYKVDWLTSGEEAPERVLAADLVILDVMLPGLDGFTVGRRLKQEAPEVPILMLSARTSVDDKLHGLHFADDYLTKPFHPDELAARIEVLLRRFAPVEQEIRLGHITIMPKLQTVIDNRSSAEVPLTAKQWQILLFFVQHPNQILTKEQIYEAVWEEPFMEGDKTVMVHIRYLREKIELNPGEPTIIETIRGLGYRVKQ